MAALAVDIAFSMTLRRTGQTTIFGYESLALTAQAYDESDQQFVEVATGVTDQIIGLGGLSTVQALLIISDQAISIKLNDFTPAILTKQLLLTGLTVTSIKVSNASGTQANVRVILAGT